MAEILDFVQKWLPLIIAAASFYLAAKKAPAEIQSAQGSAAEGFGNAAESLVGSSITLKGELEKTVHSQGQLIEKLTTTVADLQADLAGLHINLNRKTAYIEYLLIGIGDIKEQVESLGAAPVFIPQSAEDFCRERKL